MILVDASVWIDHFRSADAELLGLLHTDEVVSHPFVIGELACGHLTRRETALRRLRALPTARVVDNDHVLAFVEQHALMGRGIGWVDVHLLASAIVAGTMALWSHDKRLAAVASEHGVAYARRLH